MSNTPDTSLRNTSGMVADYSPLSQACIKALTDRLDEKRKFAANEIEKMTVEFSMSNNQVMIDKLVTVLGRKFCLSPSQNTQKGGLLGLSAVMVGFKNGSTNDPPPDMVEEVIRPILTCLLNPDPRTRFFACESLYNVTKVAGHTVLPLFEPIFDCMTRLVADSDTHVRSGSETLDRLLKDIFVESTNTFDMANFVTKLEEYIYTKNPFTRMFILSWIRLLDTKLDITEYLPRLQDGILNYLYDSNDEICASTQVLLSELLNKMLTRPIDELASPEPVDHDDESSSVSSEQLHFHKFIQALYKTFHDNEHKFEDRGKFIIVNLCSIAKPETIYRSLADIIKEDKSNTRFTYNLVQKLNQILLTTPALSSFRNRMSDCVIVSKDKEMISLFHVLIAAWEQCPVASMTLCFLVGDYWQAKEYVIALARNEITMDTLVQIDWLVQLVESPVFASLRLRLLDASDISNRGLVHALYGLLMILPQSEAYRKLSHRLDQVHKFINIQGHHSQPG